MKTCPNCKQIFGDENDFCLNDGTPLVPQAPFGGFQPSGEMPTQVISRPVQYPPIQPSPPAAHSNKWVFPVLGLLCGLVVVLGFIAFFKESSDKTASSQKNTQAVEPNINAETRQTPRIEPTAGQIPPQPPAANFVPNTVVTVNSPRDGYLALKSEPCIAPCGTTILKIPHGTMINLGACKDTFEIADRRRGRWCYTSYGGYSGWVFDAFVSR